MWRLPNLSKTTQTNKICQSLSELDISFKGPLRTTKGHAIYLIDRGILLESELLSLLKDGQFTRKAVAALAKNTLR